MARLIRQHGPWQLVITAALAVLVGVAAGRTVRSFSGSVVVVAGRSMAPTYEEGSRILSLPINTPLERGDVVLLDDGGSEYAIKRIIGLPGETVHLWRGFIFINRWLLQEPYLPRHTYTYPDEQIGNFSLKLGQNEYFVLGDNRFVSVDSREYGAVGRDRIKSRVSSSEGRMQARFLAYTLPAPGKRAIRPM